MQKAIKNLRKFLHTVETVPEEVLRSEAEQIQREALRETPARTGKLRRSVRCRVSKSAKGATLLISASALSKQGYNYAGIQHEHRGFKHTVGKSHYLIDPYRRGVSRIKAHLKRKLKPPGR